MIRIGVFAMVSQVSIKTLRHYDEMGLLKPISVDDFSGYRYYSLEQLPRLNHILALRDLGFSLDQIGLVLNTPLPSEQIRGMLRLKQSELQQRVQDDQARLVRVEARLIQIEQEGNMSQYDVVIKKVEPQLVASVSDTIPTWPEVSETFNRIFDEVCGYVMQNGGQIVGAPFDRWHDLEMPQTDMHVEAVAPISGPLPESDRVKVYEMEGAERMATTIHHGDFATIGQAHEAVVRWAEANGYRIAGPSREVYLQYERSGPTSDYVTEIQYPVEVA